MHPSEQHSRKIVGGGCEGRRSELKLNAEKPGTVCVDPLYAVSSAAGGRTCVAGSQVYGEQKGLSKLVDRYLRCKPLLRKKSTRTRFGKCFESRMVTLTEIERNSFRRSLGPGWAGSPSWNVDMLGRGLNGSNEDIAECVVEFRYFALLRSLVLLASYLVCCCLDGNGMG